MKRKATHENNNIIFNDLWATRSAGFLIPLFSLRSEKSLGIGDIGDMYPLIDWASDNGQRIIQVLPVNDTSPGDPSPYAAVSTFAVNPLYIDMNNVEEISASYKAKGLMRKWQKEGVLHDLENKERIDYPKVREIKYSLLEYGFNLFMRKEWKKDTKKRDDFIIYIEREKEWIADYAIFCVLKKHFNYKEWRSWPEKYKAAYPEALMEFEKNNHQLCLFYQWMQWIFSLQWDEMRNYAHNKGVYLMGDVCFYPGTDSSEVWAKKDLFQMDRDGNLSATAGAPPDMFNSDGQNWGNPLYNWDAMQVDDYSWWKNRVRRECNFFDLYRLDHFRGFESYWRVPAGEKAKEGGWVKGPGDDLLQKLLKISMSEKLVIPLAEDLGDISPEVHELRKNLGIAGYKTFIYGWGEGEESGIASGYRYPENYSTDFLATTGTHDTPTLLGWWEGLREDEKAALITYLGLDEDPAFIDVKESILLKLYQSKASFAIIPFQDIFCLGEEHRINLPGTFGEQNWSWRMPFTLEKLMSSSPDSDIGKAAAFIKEISSKTKRNGRNKADDETELSIYPFDGTIQKRKRGEFFNVWIICSKKTRNITIWSNINDDKTEARFYRKFVDGRYLYGATLKTVRKGIFSLTLDADGKVYRVADCLSSD